ncbi:MAG: hypothetical protein HGA45_22725 [Chloroflexales bacterium]|nr:hypothetical protein [Chloroflexales bacterium]
MAIDPTIVKTINTLLDHERQRHNLDTDVELARRLSISTKTLSLWRHGKSIPKAAVVLVRLVLAARQAG